MHSTITQTGCPFVHGHLRWPTVQPTILVIANPNNLPLPLIISGCMGTIVSAAFQSTSIRSLIIRPCTLIQSMAKQCRLIYHWAQVNVSSCIRCWYSTDTDPMTHATQTCTLQTLFALIGSSFSVPKWWATALVQYVDLLGHRRATCFPFVCLYMLNTSIV